MRPVANPSGLLDAMRDLAKSFVRLSWSMTVFGLEQLSELARGQDEGGDENQRRDANETRDDVQHRVAKAMDSVRHGAEERLEERGRSLYEAGDKLQSELIDLFFDTFDRDEWRPRRMLERAAGWADRSAETLRDLADEHDEKKERRRGAGAATN